MQLLPPIIGATVASLLYFNVNGSGTLDRTSQLNLGCQDAISTTVLGEAIPSQKCSFFNIVQTAFNPPTGHWIQDNVFGKN